jgi:hypothetical protein
MIFNITLKSRTKYVFALQQCRGNTLLYLHGNNICVLLTTTYTPTAKKREERIVTFPWQQRLRERASVTLYVNCMSFIFNFR